MKRTLSLIVLAASAVAAFAQSERADIREGNKLFEQSKFAQSEKSYRAALAKNPTSTEALFNVAGSIYKQGRWEEATTAYSEIAKAGTPSAHYNLGNTLFQQRKLDEAIESYKASLRANPSDMEAKFNLAYAQKLKQEQDKDKDKNQQQNQNQDQKQDKKDEQDQKQNEDQKKEDQKQQQQQQPKPQSRQDAERMLNAIQAAEDKTKEKVEAQKIETATRKSGNDW